MVWSVDEPVVPNYLLPRECPRVCWRVDAHTTDADRRRWFDSPETSHAVAIEAAWRQAMAGATLYIYTFSAETFSLHDEIAGYWISRTPVVARAVDCIRDLPTAMAVRGVELHVVPSLWSHFDAIQKSTFHWSMIRMRNAQPRADTDAS